MKSVRLLYRRKFDDQYTFDLQNNLTEPDFNSIVGLFNQAAELRPPPGPKTFWMGALFTTWLTASTSFYLFWNQYDTLYDLLILPSFILVSSLITSWLYRNKRIKFEENILQICGRLNATENIRGINFRFMKNGLEATTNRIYALSVINVTYAIDIEFDDRFNALKSRKFNRRAPLEDDFGYIPPPKSVYFSSQFIDEKESTSMFQDPPPPWSSAYNEKKLYEFA